MQAYLERRYDDALEHLGAWLDAGADGPEPALAALAHAAVSRLGQLVEASEAEALGPRSSALAERMAPYAAAARP
jgi:hypothetical protein